MVIGVFTEDAYLFRKIEIELDGAYTVRRSDREFSDGAGAFRLEHRGESLLLKSSDAENAREISLPFAIGALKEALAEYSSAEEFIRLGDKCVLLGSEQIRLTELEFAVISLLIERRDFVSREEILRKVWGENTDDGIVNVYIHYLRGKLERDGRRVILSSRQKGYSINPNLLKGGKTDAKAD